MDHDKRDDVEMRHQEMADDDPKADTVIGNQVDAHLSLKDALRYYKSAIVWSIIISNASIMESYDLILLKSFYAYPAFNKAFGEQLPDGTWSIPSRWQVGLAMSTNVGMMLGSFINGWISDKYPPLRVMTCCHVFVTGFVFITFFAKSVEVLLVGLFLLSIPCGFFLTSASTYVAEVSPTAIKGYLTTYINLCWVIGHLIAAGVLAGMINVEGEWSYRIPFAIQWLWPLPLAVACMFAPESPWWLARKDRLTEAEASLRRLCSAPEEIINPRQTLATISETLRIERETLRIQGGYADCFKGTNLRRTEIAMVSWGCQILPGFIIQNYSTYFFTLAGLPPGNAFKMSAGNYSIAFVGTVLSWIMITRYGRRTIYIAGLTAMLPIMFTIGFLDLAPAKSSVRWAQAAILLVWFFIYSLSIGPIPFAIGTEVGAVRLRTKTISLSRNTWYLLNIINTIVAPYMLNPANANLKGKAAFLPGSLTVCMWIWAFFRLPETKGLTPETLDHLFGNRVPTRKFQEEAKKYQ
ncbi:hypothetical protein NM208_g2757 [Fusarium decemcellulare]|uniref:Uncharacterized protein n=1 Tax=Fusarium decemcellulare TaxID=57161 RepID=A0ACC1SRB3_9HYPO|nr:hypothetical protein NM208_g2757 [Fusarium decemcellulare]